MESTRIVQLINDGLQALQQISEVVSETVGEVERMVRTGQVSDSDQEDFIASLKECDGRGLKVCLIDQFQNKLRSKRTFKERPWASQISGCAEHKKKLISFSEVCRYLLSVDDLKSTLEPALRQKRYQEFLASWFEPDVRNVSPGVHYINSYSIEVIGSKTARVFLPIGNYEEIIQEWLTACWIGLYFLYSRFDHLWSEVLYLSDRSTHGLPNGVAVYKAYGDIYRLAYDDMEQMSGLGITPMATDCRVRSVVFEPLLITGNDRVASTISVKDLNPPFLRVLGAHYYLLQLMAYMRAGFPLTILWRYESPQELKIVDHQLLRWLKFVGGKQCEDRWHQLQKWPNREIGGQGDWTVQENNISKSTAFNWAIWVAPQSLFDGQLPSSVVGIRRGVYTIRADINMPYSSRELSQGLRDSFMQGLRSMATKVRDHLYPKLGDGFSEEWRHGAQNAGITIGRRNGVGDQWENETSTWRPISDNEVLPSLGVGQEIVFDLGRLICESE